MNKKYDYVIVGAGLFGSMFNYLAKKDGKKCLIVEYRSHIGGSCYTYEDNGIIVHKYGPHIFRTNNSDTWRFVNSITRFHNFINSPIALYHGKIYNLPFNMNTFNKIWGVVTPEEAKKVIDEQIKDANISDPEKNLMCKAISMIGTELYKILVEEYTEKQWGTSCENLPSSIIRRLPLRFTYDNNYFSQEYQGIPTKGYTEFISNLIGDTEVILNEDFLSKKEYYESICDKVIYTGRIDAYYEYRYGVLPYRGLEFKTYSIPVTNYQGNAVVNYTSKDVGYTRITEHKHFNKTLSPEGYTIISEEYPVSAEDVFSKNPIVMSYYPVNNEENNMVYEKYKSIENKKVIFCGRLGEYKYYDMDNVIERCMKLYEEVSQ